VVTVVIMSASLVDWEVVTPIVLVIVEQQLQLQLQLMVEQQVLTWVLLTFQAY
jgi:hypothetical protein